MNKHYDFVVVGGGAGNIVLDAALEAGKQCAVVEKDLFGGTCLNRGCIPSKVLITVADHIRQLQADKTIGLAASYAYDWAEMVRRVRLKQQESLAILAEYEAEPNLDVYQGVAEFISYNELKIRQNSGETTQISADTIVLATGGRTLTPRIKGLDQCDIVTSESFFGEAMPASIYESVTILGGGVIGAEFAHLFAALGAKVNLVGRNEKLLPKQDHDISVALKRHFEKLGIRVFTGSDVVEASKKGSVNELVFVNRQTGKTEMIEAEVIFVCPGITPNSDLLKLDNAKIATTKSGWISTDNELRTNVPNVFVIGDANGKQQLRHKANYEAEILANNLFGDGAKREANYNLVPAAVFTYPQVATVGYTENAAVAAGYEVEVVRYDYFETAKGFALGHNETDDPPCFVKVVADKSSGIILGVHAIGEEAALLVQPYAYLMTAGVCTKRTFEESMTIHPALAEISGWAPSRLK